MREIKFKIWTDNQFYYKCLVGNTNNTTDDNWTCPMVWLEDKKEWVNCDNGIICEFTGLKDKNSVEIYENDVVRATEYLKPGEVDLYYVVKYDENKAQFLFQPTIVNGKYNNNNFNLEMIYYERSQLEVIGNIFENPDLVGGELC